MSTDYLGYVFGAVVAAGGSMGYVKKRSVPSLVAGLAFGSLAAVGAYHASSHPDTPYIGAGVSATLAGVMGSRAAKSGVMMPGGLIALLALGMFGKYSLAFYQGNSSK